MKNKMIMGMVVLLIGLGSYNLWTNTELELTQEAMALTTTSLVSVACTNPTAAVFVPGVAYTVTWAAAAAATVGGAPSATAILDGPVNSDSNPTVTATSMGATGDVLLTSIAPKMKMGGMQCQASMSGATLAANGDAGDLATIDIAFGNLADDDTVWTAGNQVDQTEAVTTLFGASGKVTTSAVLDGTATDADTLLNGEVVFGTAEATGGSEMKVQIDVSNYAPAAGTDKETLTMTLTGS